MTLPDDFQKYWPGIKKQLMQLSQEALDLAQKAEKELVRFSREGKKRIDLTTLGLRKERLCYLIGKEYIDAQCPDSPTDKLKELISEFREVDRQCKELMAKTKRKKENSG